MTEPVQNADIEDVLSSIRRLVTENHKDVRPAPSGQETLAVEALSPSLPHDRGPSKSPSSGPSKGERLVLTPALRIMPDPEPELVPESEGEAVSDARSEFTPVDAMDDVSSEGTDIGETPTRDESEWDIQSADPFSFLSGKGSETPGTPANQPTLDHRPVHDTAEHEETLDAPVQHIDTAPDTDHISSNICDPAVEDPETDNDDVTAGFDMPWLTRPAPRINLDDLTPSPPPLTQIDDEALASSASLEAHLAAIDETPREPDTAYEPAEAGDGDYAGTATENLTWVEPEDEFVVAEEYSAISEKIAADAQGFIDQAVEKEMGSDLGLIPDDASYLDEDSLREIVADIVRQELQGSLGERITRNVRKLVRREIHRALAAHDMD